MCLPLQGCPYPLNAGTATGRQKKDDKLIAIEVGRLGIRVFTLSEQQQMVKSVAKK